MKNLTIISLLLFLFQSCSGISFGNKISIGNNSKSESIAGKGKIISREYDFTGYDIISVTAPVKVKIENGTVFNIKIRGHENLLPLVEVKQNGNVLRIYMEENVGFKDEVNVTIQMPASLKKLEIGGAGSLEIDKPIDNDRFELIASGASKIRINLLKAKNVYLKLSGASNMDIPFSDTDDLYLILSGASSVKARGKVSEMKVNASGSSKVNLKNLLAGNVDCRLSGASFCDVNVTGELKTSVSGASRIVYEGTPSDVMTHISGAASVKKAD